MMHSDSQDPRASKKLERHFEIKEGDGTNIFNPIPAGREAKITSNGSSIQTIRDAFIKTGKLYEDPDFPAVWKSLSSDETQNIDETIKWMRPKEIYRDPHFIQDGISRFDIRQGSLGDCWFLASISTLALQSDVVDRVIPKNQDFKNNYCGAFYFNFYFEGVWRSVIIDDRLPTKNGKLIYVNSTTTGEFWSPLLEKAYAKLKGNYESLKGGLVSEALTDLTAGLCETYDLREKSPSNLVEILQNSIKRRSIITCAIYKKISLVQGEEPLPNGLIGGHAYSVTGFEKDITDNRDKKFNLIRIRNPWGNSTEWTGSWKDKGPEWDTLSQETKRAMGCDFKADGEFWMDLDDFKREFSDVTICHLDVEALGLKGGRDEHKDHKWQVVTVHNSWKSRLNAGGWYNYKTAYWTNPQYRLTVTADEHSKDGTGTVMIGLTLKDYRKCKMEKKELPAIGFCIWKITNPNAPMDANFFTSQERVVTSKVGYWYSLAERHSLKQGEYLLVPSGHKPDIGGSFFMRIFFETHSHEPLKTMSQPNEILSTQQTSLPPLNEANINDLKVVFTHMTRSISQTDGIYAKDLRRILIEGLKSDFMNTKIDVKAVAMQRRTYEAEGSEEIAGNNEPMPNGQEQHNGQKNGEGSKNTERRAEKGLLDGLFFGCINTAQNVQRRTAQATSKFGSQVHLPRLKDDSISLDTARSLVATMDYDRNGYLDQSEFQNLWICVRFWRKMFLEFDTDKTGTMNSIELRNALKVAGFSIDDQVFSCMVARYANKNGEITFDDYLQCCSRLKTSLEIYDAMKKSEQNQVLFDSSSYIASVMYG